MNKQNVSSVPDENEIEELLRMIQPVPSGGFHKKTEQTHRRLEQTQSQTATNKPRLRLAVAFVVFLIIIAFAITPQGRAFASTLFRYFSLANSESFPLSDEQQALFNMTPTIAPTYDLILQTVPVSNGEPIDPVGDTIATSSTQGDFPESCEDAITMLEYTCQIAFAESQVHFDVLEFSSIPRGYAFVGVRSNSTLRTITINYSVVEGGGSLNLSQGIGAMPISSSDWGEVPASAIEQVRVGDQYGEFARGQFVVYEGATLATWEADAAQLRLRWLDGNRWFSLVKSGNTTPVKYLDKDALIALATNLVYSPASDAITSIDNVYHISVAEAEAAAGFKLLVPTVLPAGFEFAYARYDAEYQIIFLHYRPKDQGDGANWLYISQQLRTSVGEFIGCADCPSGVVEQVQVNDNTAYYWQGIFDAGSDEQPLSPPAWWADAPHYTLTWATSDLIIGLYYDVSEEFRGPIRKNDLIKIAEGLK